MSNKHRIKKIEKEANIISDENLIKEITIDFIDMDGKISSTITKKVEQ